MTFMKNRRSTEQESELMYAIMCIKFNPKHFALLHFTECHGRNSKCTVLPKKVFWPLQQLLGLASWKTYWSLFWQETFSFCHKWPNNPSWVAEVIETSCTEVIYSFLQQTRLVFWRFIEKWKSLIKCTPDHLTFLSPFIIQWILFILVIFLWA